MLSHILHGTSVLMTFLATCLFYDCALSLCLCLIQDHFYIQFLERGETTFESFLPLNLESRIKLSVNKSRKSLGVLASPYYTSSIKNISWHS